MYKKRGQSHPAAMVILPLVSLTIVFAFVFLPILADLTGIQESTFFEKNFLVSDMATVINALYASPYNIIVNYDKDPYWFSYEFEKEQVIVFDETSRLETRFRYPIITDGLEFYPKKIPAKFTGDTKTQETLDQKAVIAFSKIKETIKIEANESLDTLSCRIEPIADIHKKTILVDAGHGGNDLGYKKDQIEEKNIVGSIGFSLHEAITNPKFFTRDNLGANVEDQTKKIEYTQDKIIESTQNIDIIISLHSGSYDDTSNNIKAYYSIESDELIQKKSIGLACKILNNLIKEQKLEITGISIIGIHPEDYEGAYILVKDKISILLEIGNIQSEQSTNILSQPKHQQKIANKIKEAIK